ncbi:MAG: glycoside hydrolase family 13 protein [Bernardetiaceae bacterium]|nr:glycoside hydrolase family 13 protein [Bernardetiaceae bacterium]
MRKPLLLLMSLLSFLHLAAAPPQVTRLEPPHWWVGMKNPELQILVYGPGLAKTEVSLTYPGVTLAEVTKVESPNYLFLTLQLAPDVPPGEIPIVFKQGSASTTIKYPLKAKNTAANRIQGFGPQDAVYLLMPDRFANGNPANDQLPGLVDKADRQAPFGRHGGDLDGVLQHLDHIVDLGMTALWLNPVLETNLPAPHSYHGYAITDFYRVDARLGGNEKYLQLVDECHRRGLKVIKDLVHNHCASTHWWMADLPTRDWVHQFPSFTRSNYRLAAVSDPHSARGDSLLMTNGWFDNVMPDLNQRNHLLAQYLIQNTLWWIEYAGIDGIRMDTYPYPDKEFMARWVAEVLAEYPRFNIVGEVWIHSPAMTAYWLRGTPNRDGYRSTLPSATDFPLWEAANRAFTEPTGWAEGLSRLYHVLAEDFLYQKPEENLIFLDNHDVTRYFTAVKEDAAKVKMGLALLFTMRGVPQVYYGTEILMAGDGGFHPSVRRDFPGGWPGDPTNAFTPAGRTPAQNEVYDYLKKLAQWRKAQPVIHHGKLTHFIPAEDTYVYFRHDATHCVMVAFNSGQKDKKLATSRFAEFVSRYRRARNVLTGEQLTDLSQLALPAQSAQVWELEK